MKNSIDANFTSVINRILIRSYFYAKLNKNTTGKIPSSWQSYIGQFCNYDDVRRKLGQRGLRLYLCDRFGLQYEQTSEMRAGIDRTQLSELMRALQEIRGDTKLRSRILAHNDSLQALRILSKRRETREDSTPNPYGFKTWWLTHERTTERASAKAFHNKMQKFVIRPEFILNYISFLPSKAEVLNSYKNVFPSILAVSIGRRAPQSLIHDILSSAKDISEVDESRAKVILSEISDKLKSENIIAYRDI